MSLHDNVSIISNNTITSDDIINEIEIPNKCHQETTERSLCTFCPISFSKNTGISTIKRHFKNYHKDVYIQAEQATLNINPYTEEEYERVEQINNHLFEWIISD